MAREAFVRLAGTMPARSGSAHIAPSLCMDTLRTARRWQGEVLSGAAA